MLSQLALFLIRNMVVVVALAIGLRTNAHALASTWTERAIVWKALLVLFIGVPLLAFIAVKVFPLEHEATAFLLLMAACPGAPLVFRKYKGRPVVVTIIAIVSVVVPLTIAGYVVLINDRHDLDLKTPLATLELIALKQIVPLGLGIAIATLWPRFAPKLSRVLWYGFLAIFGVALVFVFYLGAPAILDLKPWAIAAGVVIVLGSAAMGHWAGRPDPKDSEMLATIAVLGNPALALAVISSTYSVKRLVAQIAAYFILRAIAMLPYTWFAKRAAKRPRRAKLKSPTGMPPAIAATH